MTIKNRFVTYGYLVDQKIDHGDIGVYRQVSEVIILLLLKRLYSFTFPHAAGYLVTVIILKSGGLNNTLPYVKVRVAYGKAGIQPTVLLTGIRLELWVT